MAENKQIPKFGDWESEENYTAYFDKARKRKGGVKMINPSNPQQSTDVLSDDALPVKAPPFRTGVEPDIPMGPRVAKPKHERRSSRDDGDLRQISHENFNRKATSDSYHQQQHGDIGVSSGDTPKRGGRTSATGSDRSVEQSPMHPHYQAKVGGRGSGSGHVSARSSPSWEKKTSESSHGGLAPSTPGRSRLRTVTRGNETPDKTAAVPKFGDWDENDPASADGFSHIFNKVREEKQGGAAKVPSRTNDSSYPNGHKQVNDENSTMCSCLSWCKK